ncbi:hypothetical protein LINPERHAP1_LOCUS22675 [Linum perenne]
MAPWFKDKSRFILLSGYRQILDEGTPFIWQPWDPFEGHSSMTFPAYRIVTPLICYFSVQWHRPDCVLCQLGMDQPLSTFDMPHSEVMLNLEITQQGTRQGDWVARYP